MTTDTSGNYAYDFSAFPQDVAAGGSPAGMSFMAGGAAGSQPASTGGSAAAGGAPAAAGPAAMGPGAMGGGSPAGSDPSALIAQSPFGALLNLPGVTAANLFSNVNPANYSGGNPFAALASTSSGGAAPYGGNPFASIGTLVTNDYNAATQGSSASSMGASAGSNPFGGGI